VFAVAGVGDVGLGQRRAIALLGLGSLRPGENEE
jgi:hypothetical protein